MLPAFAKRALGRSLLGISIGAIIGSLIRCIQVLFEGAHKLTHILHDIDSIWFWFWF
jgi:hypothetical protein